MENLHKVLRDCLSAINSSKMTFRDVFNIMFSHEAHIAYEIIENNEIKRVTYRELKIAISGFAGFFMRECPQIIGEYVGVDLQNGPDFIIALWAVLQSGNKPYLINSYYPLPLRLKLLANLNVKAVITKSGEYQDMLTIDPRAAAGGTEAGEPTAPQEALQLQSPCSAPQLIDRSVEAGGNEAAVEPAEEARWADEMALSSSLTGLEAKICFHSGQSIANQISNATTSILSENNWLMQRYNGCIKVVAVLPFFHIFGIIVSYFWFSFFGRTTVFLQDNSPGTIRDAIKRHEVTHVFAPPILFHKLYKGIMNNVSQESGKRKKQFDKALKRAYAIQNVFPTLGVRLSKAIFKDVIDASFGKSVNFMITGGAFIDKNALKLINTVGYPLFNGYGTTETMITSVELKKRIRHRVSGSIGAPFKGVDYSISEGQILTISGNTICKRIMSFDSDTSGFDHISTNDIVNCCEGKYFIEGRRTDLFIGESGENISPDIIQNELSIKTANEFSVLELDGKLSLVLEYNRLFPDSLIIKEVEKIKHDLQSIDYGLSVSEIFITRNKISTASSLKTSRTLLRKQVAEGGVQLLRYSDLAASANERAAAEPQAPDDAPMIGLLKDLFKQSLDTAADIGIHDNFFFDLGGTSLDYFTLLGKLSEVFNVQINIEQKNNLYTVYDIHKYLMEVL